MTVEAKNSPLFLFLKHFKHSIGDHEAAHDVQGTHENRQKTQGQGQVIVVVRMAHHDDGANDDHAVDGVGARHQRGVQDGGHVGNHLDPQQNGEQENVDKVLIFNKKIGNEMDF